MNNLFHRTYMILIMIIIILFVVIIYNISQNTEQITINENPLSGVHSIENIDIKFAGQPKKTAKIPINFNTDTHFEIDIPIKNKAKFEDKLLSFHMQYAEVDCYIIMV